jgi:hypothetical protein
MHIFKSQNFFGDAEQLVAWVVDERIYEGMNNLELLLLVFWQSAYPIFILAEYVAT